MNTQSVGALAAFLAVLIWVVSRRKPTPFASLDASAVAALNRAQISLVQQKVERSSPTPAVSWPLPADPRQQAAFLKTLHDQLAGDTGERLAAMQAPGLGSPRHPAPAEARLKGFQPRGGA